MLQDEAIKKLIENTDKAKMKDGDIKITEPCICQSNAGFYVGTWFVELISDELFPMPYSRESGYMSKEVALDHLSHF